MPQFVVIDHAYDPSQPKHSPFYEGLETAFAPHNTICHTPVHNSAHPQNRKSFGFGIDPMTSRSQVIGQINAVVQKSCGSRAIRNCLPRKSIRAYFSEGDGLSAEVSFWDDTLDKMSSLQCV